MDATSLLETLRGRVPAATIESIPAIDFPTFSVSADHIVDTLRALRDDSALAFATLLEITAVDYLPRTPRFEVVYHLARLGVPDFPRPGPSAPAMRLRLKVMVEDGESVPTASVLYPAADWLEREVWDLFGITFAGHPDQRRLLMPEDWEGHPLRKDYPVQVNVPYKSTERVQVSEEEFVANIQRQRRATGYPPV
jgi:NADH-quinone oxidoreductase subunit C